MNNDKNDENDKAGDLLAKPLPIVMVLLFVVGVLVKNVPLESARPTDPERVKFVPTSQQDVEARLWQDPFAAVEQHEKLSDQVVTPTENILMMHTPETLCKRIQALHEKKHDVTVVAVSVFGNSYAEAAESRRRSRFAVVSALGFHDYYPENAEAIGYFHTPGAEPDAVKLTIPYEWFEKRGRDKLSNVLVLWLNEDKLSPEPLNKLQTLFAKLTLTQSDKDGPNVKLIGSGGSALLTELIRDGAISPPTITHCSSCSHCSKQDFAALEAGRLEVFAPTATVSNCDLSASADEPGSPLPWNCFMTGNPVQLKNLTALPIVRTTGTDDVLAAALLWELWQRGVNREFGYVDSWWKRGKGQGDTSFSPKCEDGLVLIGERDTGYGRTLLQYLNEGFLERCKPKSDANHDTSTDKPLVYMFTYLRGLDGMLPDIDKSSSKASPKDDSSKSKDLRAQLEDAPPEHAEGRNQLDYLRRLADEIDRLDRDKKFAEKGVKAIGIVGSDVYDKLLILQALRSRFKDKIFFTTDLDARYLHADQKDWARNLVVASNFGLSLRPRLQYSTLPFRDSYQTATYLATLMALEKPPHDGWSGKMKEWLRPQIFEIGRTEAVHLASPSVPDLTEWLKINGTNPEGILPPAKFTECGADWKECEGIEPDWSRWGISLEHSVAVFFMIIFGIMLIALASCNVQQTLRAACDASSPEREAAMVTIATVISAVFAVFIFLAIVWIHIDDSLTRGVGEPFTWREGISVWPSLVLLFVGFMIMLALMYAFRKRNQQREKLIFEYFEIAPPRTWLRARSWWSAALTGPHLDLASFDKEGKANPKPPGAAVEIATLWQNYLRATSFREMAWWAVFSMLLVILLNLAVFHALGWPSIPLRGPLVEILYCILMPLGGVVFWLVIFWVSYETRACAQFIDTLSGVPNKWPERLLVREEAAIGLPRGHLDDYLDFQLIVHATQRIYGLIYLPFVPVLFMVLSRSNFFEVMDFPPALVFITGLALAYALYSAVLLRKSAEKVRTKALEHYEELRLALTALTRPPISAEPINLLMERIRNTHEGAFASFVQQPALRALLLPFGGYGGALLAEHLINV